MLVVSGGQLYVVHVTAEVSDYHLGLVDAVYVYALPCVSRAVASVRHLDVEYCVAPALVNRLQESTGETDLFANNAVTACEPVGFSPSPLHREPWCKHSSSAMEVCTRVPFPLNLCMSISNNWSAVNLSQHQSRVFWSMTS